MKNTENPDSFAEFLGAITVAILIVLVAIFCQTCTAQTCGEPARLLRKGDTAVAACDSLILIPANALRLRLNLETKRANELIRISLEKDKAAKLIFGTFEARIANYQKQVEVVEIAYRTLLDTTRQKVFEAKVDIERIRGQVELLKFQLKTANDNLELATKGAELERAAAKGVLWKRSLIWGSVGVGVGGIITTFIFIAK